MRSNDLVSLVDFQKQEEHEVLMVIATGAA